MNTANILHINSSGRYEGSITRQVSDLVVEYIKGNNVAHKKCKQGCCEWLAFCK